MNSILGSDLFVGPAIRTFDNLIVSLLLLHYCYDFILLLSSRFAFFCFSVLSAHFFFYFCVLAAMQVVFVGVVCSLSGNMSTYNIYIGCAMRYSTIEYSHMYKYVCIILWIAICACITIYAFTCRRGGVVWVCLFSVRLLWKISQPPTSLFTLFLHTLFLFRSISWQADQIWIVISSLYTLLYIIVILQC